MHKLALAGLLSLAFIVPAVAQDATCYTQAQLETDTKAAAEMAKDTDIHIVGGASYNGATSDSIVIVQGGSEILAFMFKGGCMVGYQAVDGVGSKVGA